MRLMYSILACLLVTWTYGAEVRTWTSQGGKTIEAEFIRVGNGRVSLRGTDGTMMNTSFNALSKEDQAFITQLYKDMQEKTEADARAAAKEAAQERAARLAKERAERLANIKRGTYVLTLEAKMFPHGKDYYSTTMGKSSYKALKKKGDDPLAQVGYIPANERAKVYVPAHYDDEKKFGIYIHISAGNGPSMPNYNSIMDKRDMIMASPFKGGNQENDMRRIMLALDTVATLKKNYVIDDARIYVGGISGGGITALEAQLIHPNIWGGALSHARGMNLGTFGEYYSESKNFDKNEFRRMSRMKRRFAVISGPKDFNYEHCRKSASAWKDHGFDIRFFDVPSMGHNNAPEKEFEKALDWVRKEEAK